MNLNAKDFAILYVDDEPANLTTFTYCFEEEFHILSAQTAEAALRILATQPVAILLTDQRMPAMTGAELCARVRDLYPDVVRMVVSAYADISAAVEAINNGQVSRYILKPWREADMATVLRSGIEAYHLGLLVKRLQLRLLQSEQQAGAHLMLNRVLHELSNPAAAIGGNVRFIADSTAALVNAVKHGPPDALRLVEEIRAAAVDALEAYQALDSRIEHFRSGEGPTDRRPKGIDLARAVISAVAIVRSELQKRAQLFVNAPSNLPPVAIDPTHASQILVNLLINANEAMDSTQAESNRVDVTLAALEGHAIIEVADTGCGIADADLPRIFEPFFSSKNHTGSHGLGLAIVKELVETCGGSIRVASTRGRGTTFTVHLPFART